MARPGPERTVSAAHKSGKQGQYHQKVRHFAHAPGT